jgi:hypothetical protein
MIPSAVAQYQAEGRWLTLVRLLFVATCLSWFGLLVWALPSLAGLTAVSDTSSAVALTAVFCLAAAGFSIASWIVWKPLLRNESRLELFRIVGGGRKSIRDEAQFQSRLAQQCRRAQAKAGEGFILAVLRAPKKAQDARGDAASRTHPGLAALVVRSAAREDDVVAVAPPYEVWLLARGDADALRHSVIPRLERALDHLESSTPCQLGIAAFGDDGTAPEQLFTAARTDLRDISESANATRAA